MGEVPEGTEFEARAVVPARPIDTIAHAPQPWSGQRFDLSPLTRRDAGFDLALVASVALLVPLGFQLSAQLIIGQQTGFVPPTEIQILGSWFDALLALVLAGYFVHRHRVAPAAFGLQADNLHLQVAWALPALGAIYVVMIPTVLLVAVAVFMVPGLESDLARRTEFMKLIPVNNLAQTISLLIPVAIGEELIFRGLLIPYLRRVGCGWAAAILVSTAVFAVLHYQQGWLGVVQVFPIGIVLALFFVLSRSLLSVMIAHFLFDFLQTQLVRVLLPWMEKVSQNA